MSVFVDEDFVAVYAKPAPKQKRKVTLAFGDEIELLRRRRGRFHKIRVHGYFDGPFHGWVDGEPRVYSAKEKGVLKFSMVDVQQGDGMILETPQGKIVWVDGGDNKLFARHVAARYRHRRTTAQAPLEVDAIIVTHGDADHFDGLNEVRRSESYPRRMKRKSLFVHPKRVFHNGLVKGPSERNGKSLNVRKRFGNTVTDASGRLHITDLYDDPRKAPSSDRNIYFKRWIETLDHWESTGNGIECHRVGFDQRNAGLFDFLQDDGIQVEVQGPFPSKVRGKLALPFLHKGRTRTGRRSRAVSASHTINGHSIALRLTYGNVRFSLTGDLTEEAMEIQGRHLDTAQIRSEIVKAPHHGSHDFDFDVLRRMAPVVAICSSGDESAWKEHIHPRATLMAALGKSMREETGVVFVTELAAFFATKKYSHTREELAAYFSARKKDKFTGEELRKFFASSKRPSDLPTFYAFERTNFGIIHIRTDGERVLAFTHSGKKDVNEAYRFSVRDSSYGRSVEFAPRPEIRS